MLRYGLMLCLTALLSSLLSCGDNVSIKDASGNAMLVVDARPAVAVDNEGITINQVRVWKSTPNDQAPGVYSAIDDYTIEIWATLEGEAQSRYYRKSGFIADVDGNLFAPALSPGQIKYHDRANAAILETPASYTITASDPFIGLETSAGINLTKTAVSGTATSTTEVLADPALITQTPWTEIKYREYTQTLFQRARQEKNVDLALKAKMGCMTVTKGVDGSVAPGSYQFQDVELGNAVRMGSQTVFVDSGATGVVAADTSGDDNFLVLEWQEAWYLTGLNVTTRRIRMVRERWVPFYHRRELPGVDRSNDAPLLSGMETLVRSCNASAESTGAFRLVYMRPSAVGFSATLSTSDNNGTSNSNGHNNIDNAYCPNLKSAASGDATVVNSIPLNEATYAGNYSTNGTDSVPLGCNFASIFVGAGSWTGGPTAGRYHNGNVAASVGDTYFHFEQSKITETAL